MRQTASDRSHGYEMPPPLIHALVRGTTWRLNCRDCNREVAVDVIRMVESVDDVRDFDSEATFARARCPGVRWADAAYRRLSGRRDAEHRLDAALDRQRW